MSRRDEFLRGLEKAGGWPDGEPEEWTRGEMQGVAHVLLDLVDHIQAAEADATTPAFPYPTALEA